MILCKILYNHKKKKFTFIYCFIKMPSTHIIPISTNWMREERKKKRNLYRVSIHSYNPSKYNCFPKIMSLFCKKKKKPLFKNNKKEKFFFFFFLQFSNCSVVVVPSIIPPPHSVWSLKIRIIFLPLPSPPLPPSNNTLIANEQKPSHRYTHTSAFSLIFLQFFIIFFFLLLFFLSLLFFTWKKNSCKKKR